MNVRGEIGEMLGQGKGGGGVDGGDGPVTRVLVRQLHLIVVNSRRACCSVPGEHASDIACPRALLPSCGLPRTSGRLQMQPRTRR
eukprot:COSAG03_NODE_14899_length_448_cov_0.664756_1_plen_84_part_10